MDEFIAAADTLKAAGVTGFGPWRQGRLPRPQTFENTLLGALGPETYNALFPGEAPWDERRGQGSDDLVRRMLDYVNEDFSALAWTDATALVIEGRAGFNSMGDWAYGEVVAKDADDNIGWVSYPGQPDPSCSSSTASRCRWARRTPENCNELAQDARLEGGAGGVQSAEGLDPGADGRSDRRLLAVPPVVDGELRNDALVPSARPRPGVHPAFKQAFYDAATAFVTDKDVEVFSPVLGGCGRPRSE